MGISISSIGRSAVMGSLTQLQNIVNERLDVVVQKAAVDCAQYATDTSPVDTGEMRDGFDSADAGNMSSITYNDVEHSLYVELGTYKMAAQPTLYPAFIQARDELLDACSAIIPGFTA